MKVNLQMLRDDMPELNLNGHLEDEPWVARCTHPVACSKPIASFDDEAIYICNPGQLPRHVPRGCSTPSVIVAGKPSGEWLMAPCNILYTEGDEDILELFNLISESIARYQSWEDDLMGILDDDASEDELVACIRRYIRNPFFVQGSEFDVMLGSIPEDAESTPLLERYREEYESLGKSSFLSPEDISLFLSDDEYYSSKDKTEPSIYSGRYFDCRTLFYNISLGGVAVGRIAVDEVVQPILDRDFVLVKVLGQHLAKTIDRSRESGFYKAEELEPILQGLLAHKLLPEEKIDHLLDSLGWGMYDRYACLVLKLKPQDGPQQALKPLMMGVSKELELECCTVFEGSIIFACNLTMLGKDGDEMLSEALPYLRDNLLMASLSTSYDDFKDLYYYFRQAEFAFEAGLRRDPGRWAFRFEEYEADYLVGKAIGGTIPEALMPEGLKDLRDRDRRKGRDDIGLLRTYLDNDRNIAETTRLEHMSRSTFRYRMKKIEETLGLDLDDPDVRLSLQMTLRAMESADGRDG